MKHLSLGRTGERRFLAADADADTSKLKALGETLREARTLSGGD